jgi:hypothetical protein
MSEKIDVDGPGVKLDIKGLRDSIGRLERERDARFERDGSIDFRYAGLIAQLRKQLAALENKFEV